MPRMHAPTALVRALTFAVATTPVALPTLVAHAQDAVQWRVEDGGNGHWYAGFSHGSVLTWYEAQALSESMGGHLATPSTEVENTWLKNHVANNQSLWPNSPIVGPWFGGFRSAEGEWGWVDGSEWSFQSWHPGNPDSPLGSDAALLYWDRHGTFGWQDHELPFASESSVYLVEWSADCNGDGIVDYGQILDGTFADENDNGVPDPCDPVQWRVEDGGNGHWYRAISTIDDVWAEIEDEVQALGGRLAAFETETEWNWIRGSLVEPHADEFFKSSGWGVCLGGIQIDTSTEPFGGWVWNTGAPFTCGGSFVCEMENYNGNQHRISLVRNTPPTIGFNDIDESFFQPWSMVEWSADCNGDGVVDYGQILAGELDDADRNGVPDCCEDGSCRANLVENGSFERGLPLGPCTWAWTDGAGTNPIPGWTVTQESVARFRIDASDVHCFETWRAPDGQYSIDLDGENPGAIATTIETVPGESYELTFKLTGNCDPNQVERRVAVTVGTETREFVHQCEFDGDESWSTRRWRFVPTDEDTTIVFASLSPAGSRNGAVIDDVVVTVYQHPGGEDEILDVPTEYATIQAAVDAAYDDMTILVAPGVYTPDSTIDLFDKRLVLRGATDGDGAPRTILDGDNLRRVLHCRSDETVEIVIENFAITGGSGSNGGGLLVEDDAHAMLRNCTFTANAATGYGGAVAVVSGDASFLDCRFEGNSSDLGGGALGLIDGRATLERCRIESNTGPQGGGMNVRDGSELSLADCRLVRNVGDGGGAIHGWSHSDVVALRCDFWANEAPSLSGSAHGGAMYLHRTSGSFTDCLFLENVSAGHAGAIITYLEPVSISDCLFIANEGGFAGNTFLVNGSVLTMNDSTVCDGDGDWIAYQGGGSLSGSGNTITGSCSLDDCDGDGTVDAVQILEGTLTDCDRNLVPDECELTDLLAASEPRTPESIVDFVEFDVSAMADARDTVSVELSARGDLATTSEFMFVYLDDANLGLAFVVDGAACDTVSTMIEIPAADWNAAGLDGTRLIRISGNAIDPTACPDPFTAIDVTVPVVFEDCNTNGLWDACEVADGSVLDSDDDGVIDDCDGCPDDPAKTDPGVCGCGTPETGDTDADGILDCIDPCPTWPYDCSEDGQTLFVAVGEPIQLAIDVVPGGGVVELAAGTHVGTGAAVVEFVGKPLTLRGALGGDPVVIDGENSRRGLYCSDPACSGSVVENLEIRNGDYGFAGGGAYLRDVDVTFDGCVFSDNRASGANAEGYGGGLYALRVALTLNDSAFQHNVALGNGGGVYLDNGCTLVAVDLNFNSNDAGNAGGGVHFNHQAAGTITSSTFTMNTSRYGGATYLDQDNSFNSRFESCVFDSNSAESGGALRSANGADTQIIDCDFQANHATVSGGGIDAVDDATLAVRGSIFNSNEAAMEGGAILASGRTLDVHDSSFISNQAVFYGGVGALQLDFVEIQNVIFDGNVAMGSSGAFDAYQTRTVTIDQCTVINNLAMGEEGGGWGIGAGLRLNGILDSATISGCDIRDNIAFGDGIHETEGGGILVQTATGGISPQISNSVVCGNSPDQIAGPFTDLGGNCITEVCDSDNDGTLDCLDGCPEDPDKIDPGQCGCGVEDVDTDADGIADCVDPCPNWPYDCGDDGQTIFVAVGQSIQQAIAAAPAGGTVQIAAGIFNPGGSIDPAGKAVTIQGTVDESNQLLTTIDASGTGSVMVFQSGETETTVISNLVLTGGAAVFGGGIECSNASSPRIRGCLITGNTASEYGGGINCYLDCNPDISECTIRGNTATLAGGGISVDDSSPIIFDCIIEANTAPQGAGIYFYESEIASLGDSTVCGNDADQVSGSYFEVGVNCILDECGDDFDGNGFPDACDPDCNGDGIPDSLETDCDENGIPDECEVADGTADDCNGNGIPDSCDIESGFDEDENGNDIPDACDVARGDLNLDGCIDAGDLGLLIALWGIPDPPVGDLNGDGVISAADLGLLIGNWEPCDP